MEDHALFGEAIEIALQDLGMSVIGVARTGRDAIDWVKRSRPEIVLMDLGLPDESGLVVGRKILERWPETKILAVTVLNDRVAAKEALRAGFVGYLTKDASVPEFMNTIRSVADGQVVVPKHLSPTRATLAEDGVALLASQLSRREREVLTLLVRGFTGEAVAKRLAVSRNTVRTHIQNILMKLQVHSRLEAVTFAVQNGLVAVPGPNARLAQTGSDPPL